MILDNLRCSSPIPQTKHPRNKIKDAAKVESATTLSSLSKFRGFVSFRTRKVWVNNTKIGMTDSKNKIFPV